MDADTKKILEDMQAQITALSSENTSLKKRLDSPGFAGGVPEEFQTPDPSIDPREGRFARSVVIETVPGAAAEYAKWSGKGMIVNPNGLVRNSRSNPVEG